MKHLILSPSLIGGLYLILLFIFSGIVCVFVKLCVFYYKWATAKPEPKKSEKPEKQQCETPKKKRKPRTPVRKIIINPDEINKIYVKTNEK